LIGSAVAGCEHGNAPTSQQTSVELNRNEPQQEPAAESRENAPPPEHKPHLVRWQYQSIYKTRQEQSNWCWAAALEMCLRSSGLSATQADIVRAIKGRVVNETISTAEMLEFGRGALRIRNDSGAPSLDDLGDFLQTDSDDNRHFIIEWRSTGPDSSHSVMVTGIRRWSSGEEYVRIYDPDTPPNTPPGETWFNFADERRRWESTKYLTFDKLEAVVRLILSRLSNAN
jgi:hypothetical protein